MFTTTQTQDLKTLVLDTEVGLRWWWYDGKGTSRLGMWVGQWLHSDKPFGNIILPRIVLEDSKKRYRGLPVTDRVTALENLRTVWDEMDMCIGHNVRNFDWTGINGEMLIAGLPPLSGKPIHDTLKDMKSSSGQSRSLGNLLPRLTKDSVKDHVHPAVWEAALNDFEPKALKEVWNRCITDVMGHWELHKALVENNWMNDPKSGGSKF